MSTLLSTLAVERSTYAVMVAFTDEEGDAVTPNSGLTWTLTDRLGNVINSRDGVSISSASSVTIVLSGADLDADDGLDRVLLVEGTYDSDLGSNLPLNEEVRFRIQALVAV